MTKAAVVVLLAGLLLAGCASDIQNKEAVRQGVIDHLSANAGLDLGSMDVEVTSVMFRENEADATVAFRPRGAAGAEAGLQMRYVLERSGGNWVVKSKAEAGGSPHGESPGGEMPPGHPPMGGAPEESPPAGDPL
ncbi:MAG: hypothetical protein GY953_10645 [bacterium]|nr:hypothetical protein [bacterium]